VADLPGALGKQIGPFPVAGWLAIGAAGVGLAMVIRRSDLFGADDGGAMEVIGDPVADGSLFAPVDGSVGTGVVPISPQPRPAGSTGPTTNGEWATAAVRWAIGAGHDPNTAAGAAANYLGGIELTAAQGRLLGLMLAAIGPPPEGAPAPDIAGGGTPTPVPIPIMPGTPPAPAPRTAPGPTALYYATVSGSTFAGIANHFYGSTSYADELHGVNRDIKAPGVVADLGHRYGPGVRILLPAKLGSVSRIRTA
jgi:hypothetical protein